MRHPLLCVIVILAMVAPGAPEPLGAQTILNVERLQPGDVQEWHWGTEGALSMSQGNSNYVDILAGLVLGHRWAGDWLRGFAGVDYRSERGKGLESDRYLHVRYNHWLGERWQTFHFVQLQGSRTSLLQQRVLLGSGLRRRLFDGAATFDLGTGAMYEREHLDPDRITGAHPVESQVWRMANLMVATRRLTDSVRLIGVSYYQPDLSAFEDFRLLADLSLVFSLTENVELVLRNEWRHDHRPPEGIDRDDFLLRTGVTVSVR